MTGAPNPFETPTADPSPYAPTAGRVDVEAVRQLARVHRQLIMVFLGQIVFGIGFVVVVGAAGAVSEQLAGILSVVWLIVLLGLFLALLV